MDKDIVMTHSQLIARLEELTGPDREVDGIIFGLLHKAEPRETFLTEWDCEKFQFVHPDDKKKSWYVNGHIVDKFTTSIDSAVALSNALLPGWSWRVASCCVSDDAWVEPDYNCPVHGDRLKRAFPPGQIDWVDLTDVDLRPSGRPAIALCIAILKAHGASK